MVYYCPSCKKAIIPESALKCPSCGTSEYHFLSSGLCGCEDCYSVFRSSIIQGIESYRKEVFVKGGKYRLPGRQAMARLQTYFEIRKSAVESRSISRADADSSATIGAEKRTSALSDYPEDAGDDLEYSSTDASEPLQHSQVQMRLRMARNIPGMYYYHAARHRSLLEAVFLSDRGFLTGLLETERDDFHCRVAVGDEDHFRFGWSWVTDSLLQDGERKLGNLLNRVRRIDQAFIWQYSTIFGYLTACPTNSGSGLRLSARIRVPGLLADPSWLRWKRELHRAGFEVRPGSGEKSFPDGEHIQLVTRQISGTRKLRPILERFRIYIARLLTREERIGEKILATGSG